MADFISAISRVLENESGDVIPNDNGRGPSKWGITLKTAQEYHPNMTAADIYAMTPASAAEFYRMAFWTPIAGDAIYDQDVAYKVLDMGINMGVPTAIRLLQGVVGSPQDGRMGPKTIHATNSAQPADVLVGLRSASRRHYKEIVQARPEYAKFLKGWLKRADI